MASVNSAPGARIEHFDHAGVRVACVTRDGLSEMHITAAPSAPGADPDVQAHEVFATIGEILCAAGAVAVQERVFGEVGCSESVLSERGRRLYGAASGAGHPVNYIEGPPCGGSGLAGAYVYAVSGVSPAPVGPPEEPAGASFVHQGAEHVYLTGLRGDAGGRPASAEAMFRAAAEALGARGLSYTDVARTWIYLHDILDWYAEFNAVRSRLYAGWGIGENGSAPHPASTGIEGRPAAGGACAMDVYAIGGDRSAVRVEQMHNPAQNEAYSYGSAFSRGMAVRFGGVETAYVSGTASIDEAGNTVHLGDVAAQTHCTLDKVEALLGTRGMTLEDTVAATLFVKRFDDADLVRQIVRDRSERLAGGIVVRADVCRDDLLFEAEIAAAKVVTEA